MKLQVSYDLPNLPEALSIAEKTASFADIIEVGTLLIYKEGVKAVEEFKKAFSKKEVAVNAKICDRVTEAIEIFAQAGTNYITVLAGTSDNIIFEASKKAHAIGAKAILDLLDAYSLGQSARDAEQLGVDAILFHRTTETEQEATILEQWETTRGNTKLPIHLSGKVSRSNIHKIIQLKPQVISIGAAIVQAQDPAAEAQFFKSLIEKS